MNVTETIIDAGVVFLLFAQANQTLNLSFWIVSGDGKNIVCVIILSIFIQSLMNPFASLFLFVLLQTLDEGYLLVGLIQLRFQFNNSFVKFFRLFILSIIVF